jgi:hypothetical protein
VKCLLFAALLSGCIPTALRARDSELMYEQALGYRGPDTFERYTPPTTTLVTSWGIRYAGKVDPARLHAEHRRFEVVVLVPDDASHFSWQALISAWLLALRSWHGSCNSRQSSRHENGNQHVKGRNT